MQDGFDKSVAGKMPKSLKGKPNRPWNVDPVLLHKPSVDQERLVLPKDKEGAGKDASVQEGHVKVHGALDTIENISTEFTDALFQKKDAQRHLRETQAALENTVNKNSSLKTTLVELEKRITNEEKLRQEISFLNEQAEDANLYMENISMMLTEKTKETEDISVKKKGVEDKLYRLNEDIHSKATLEVKVSILEKELGLAHNRVKELETLLHAQQEETVSLGKESKELKGALDKVYASLAHIRLKAKKEAYGL